MQKIGKRGAFFNAQDVRLIANLAFAHPRPSLLAPQLPTCQISYRLASRPCRTLKTKTMRKVKDLEQGIIQAEPLPALDMDEHLQYPPVVQGARDNMIKFNNCVLLTRVGNFYEVRRFCIPNFALSLPNCSCTSSMRNNMLPSSTSSWHGRRRMPGLSQWLASPFSN